MMPPSLHNRGRKCAQRTRKWTLPAYRRGVGWCGCGWLCKPIGHSSNEPDGMIVVILKSNELVVGFGTCRYCMTLWTCLLRDLKKWLPEHPFTSLGLFAQAFAQAGSDINGSKVKICRRTGCLGCSGPVFVREDASHRLHREWCSLRDAGERHTGETDTGGWVSRLLTECFMPSLSFMQVQIWCHTLPLSKAGDAAHNGR